MELIAILTVRSATEVATGYLTGVLRAVCSHQELLDLHLAQRSVSSKWVFPSIFGINKTDRSMYSECCVYIGTPQFATSIPRRFSGSDVHSCVEARVTVRTAVTRV